MLSYFDRVAGMPYFFTSLFRNLWHQIFAQKILASFAVPLAEILLHNRWRLEQYSAQLQGETVFEFVNVVVFDGEFDFLLELFLKYKSHSTFRFPSCTKSLFCINFSC